MHEQIKPIPSWWRWVPGLGAGLAAAIYPTIFLPPPLYRQIKAQSVTPELEAILIHERTHLARQKARGLWLWALLYLSSRRFRLQEELVAIAAEMAWRRAHGLGYDIERKARQFASVAYGWMLSSHAAKKILRQLWLTVREQGVS